MDKRGQFFILGAMILMLALFVLVAKVNTYEEKLLLEDFPELTSNYKEEAPRVINDALLSQQDPTVSIDKFTANYLAYARTIDPNLGIVYAYRDPDGKVLIKNYYTSAITIPTTVSGTQDLFPTSEETYNGIGLDLGGTNFKQTVSTKLNVYDSSYNTFVTNDKNLGIEIDGILYPINLATNNLQDLQVVEKSSSETGDLVRVDIS